MEERTVDGVLAWFEDAVRERRVVTPSQWVDAGLILYKELVLQKAKCERVTEFIRLSKRRASMTDSELRA